MEEACWASSTSRRRWTGRGIKDQLGLRIEQGSPTETRGRETVDWQKDGVRPFVFGPWRVRDNDEDGDVGDVPVVVVLGFSS